MMNSSNNFKIIKHLLPPLLTLLLSYFTYFHHYSSPPYFFWDENYHVAHAQKYLNHVFFMEPHPPLGKLLIALGEKLIHPNSINNQFIGTDHAPTTPPDFSFAGYRLIPTLLAFLTAGLMYGVFLNITKKTTWALLLSFLYIFDNALIVHSRGAMLEGTQIFFMLANILTFLLLFNRERGNRSFLVYSLLYGITLAGVLTTKVTGLVLVLLIPALILQLWPQYKKILIFAVSSSLGFILVYVLVWQIHFSFATNIEPSLPNNGYYQASSEYKKLLKDKQTSFLSFPLMLKEAWGFLKHYEKGVPVLNLCNQNENGSPFYFWPFGARSINYRWERKDNLTQYLYLQANPVVWLVGLLGILSAGALLFAHVFLEIKEKLKNPILLGAFLALYVGYMGAMGLLPRVMYLYHYFIPLIFTFILFAIVLAEIKKLGIFLISDAHKTVFLSITSGAVVFAYQYFGPLTYYGPLSNTDLEKKAWFSLWDLHCPSCKVTNKLAFSTCDPKIKVSPGIYISGVRCEGGTQDWGEPEQNRTVEKQDLIVAGKKYVQGIGVHANSSFKFRTKKQFSLFEALVGLPDYIATKSGTKSSVFFEVLGDGRLLWKSKILSAGMAPEKASVDISKVELVELIVKDGGDGIDNDHACWLEPSFLGPT